MVVAGEILLIAGGVRVAGGIQPLARPAFSEMRAGNQAGGFPLIIEGCGKLLRCRRQACQIEGNPAQECGGIRLGGGLQTLLLKLGEDEAVDGVFHP